MSCNNNVALHNKKDGGRATRRSYRKHTPRNAEELLQYHQDLKAIKEATDHNKHDECKEMRGTVDSSHLSEGLYFLDSPLGNETPLSSNPFNVTFISVPDDTGKILKLEPSRRISGSQPYVDALKPVIRRVKAFEAQFQRGNLENSLDKIMPTIDKGRSFFRSKSTNLGVHQQRPDTYEEQVSKALEGLEFRFLSDEKQKNGDKTHPLISSKASETNTNDENREVEGGSPQKHFSIGALIKKDKIARTICPFFIAACEAHLIDPSTKVKEEFCTGVWRPLIPMCKGIKPIPPQKLPDDPITANYLLAKKVNHRGKYTSVEYSNSHTTKCGNHVKVHDVYLSLSKIKPIYSLEFYREVCIELEKSRAFEKRKKRVEERDLDFKRKNDMLTVNNVDFLANDPFDYSTATSQMNSNTGMREFTQVRPTSNRCRSSFSAASSNDDRVQSDRESNVVSWVDDLKDDGGTNTVRVHTPLPPIPTDYDPSDVLTFRWLIEGIDDRMREIDSCSDTDDSGDNDQKEWNVHTKSKVREGNNLHNPKVRLRYHFFRCYELACELCNFTLCKVMPSELYKGDFDKYKNLINKERSRIERAKGHIEEAILQLKEDKLKEHNKSLECDLPLVTVSCKSSSSIYSHGQVRDPSLLNSEVTSKYSLDQMPHSVGRIGSKAGDTSIFNSSPQEIEENLEIIRSRLRAVRALSNLSRERLSQLTHNTTDLCVDDHSLNKADTVDDRLSETSSQTRSSVSCVTSCETGKSVSITHESTSKKHNKTPLESLLEMTTSLEASFNGSVANDRSKIGNIRRKMKHLSSKSQTLQAAADQHELWLSLATYRLTRPPLHACAHLAGQRLEDEQEMKKQVLDLKNAEKIKATAKKQSVDKIKKDSGNSGEDENKADESTTQCNISNMENFQKPQDTILPILGLLEVFSIFSDGAADICGEDDVKLSKSEQQAALSELVNCLYTDNGRAREDTHTNRDSQSHRQVGVLQRFVGSVEGSLLKEMAVHYSAFIAAINDPVLGMFGNTGGAAVTRSSKTANGETIKTNSRRNTEEEENELLPKIFKTIYSKRRVIASAAPRILIDAVLGYVCSVAGSPNPEGGAANQYYPSDLSYGQSDYTTNESKEQQKRHSQIRSTVSEIKHYYQEIEFNNSFLKCQSSVSRGFRKKKKDDQSLSTIEHRISGVVEAPIDGLKPITAIFPPRTGTLKTQDNEDRASAPTTPNIQGRSFIDNTENIEPLTPHFQEPLIDLHQIVKNNTYLATTTAEERLRMHFLANARNSKLFEEVILRLRGELVFLFTGIDTRRTLLSKQSIRELNTYKIWQKTPHITSDTTRVISLQQITSNSQGAKVRLPKPPCNRNLPTDNLLSKRSPSTNSRHSRTPNEHNCMVITINDEQMASIKNDNIDELLNSEARKDVAETLLQDMRTPQGNTLTGEGIYRDETPRCTSVITCSSMRSRSRTRLDAGRSVTSSPKEQHFIESLAMFDQTKKSALIAPDEPLSKSHSENKMKTITLLDNNTTSAISHSTMVDTKQGRQISGNKDADFQKPSRQKKDPIDRVPRPPSIFVAPKSIHRKIFSKTLQSMRKRTVPVGHSWRKRSAEEYRHIPSCVTKRV